MAHGRRLETQRALRSNPRLEAGKPRPRDVVQRGLDALQFRFDAFPRLAYQPLPWLGKLKSGRAEGTFARRSAIEGELERIGVASALDIGCQTGFFVLSWESAVSQRSV